ncbi:Mannosyl-D-glycerate transport/metabolism system repressor MngR [Nonomuraea coxensis DSM 45129]|uniref:Mannosyl-D-glycerate transport/metabolism system repressor MngR n=1 Tax=Nonomuraea coxensis DSM 45129 TaxID=1122611 RepID=A0ABX8TVX7_9ACTN|nr:GntR family transcriptional regulator [Nonomuraea coxensis]QYC39636.1 Mannosyl-D-glycerate transport/metabolism system repressor MngR [Nonomuraea coxensis DSM 45129]
MLDRDGPVPLYIQVAEIIEERIASGELTPGDAVPSEAAMEEEFEIARTTARNVARELRRRRLVHTVQGEGTFVGPPGVPLRKRSRAIYVRIADEIARRIRRGELRPHGAIPSEESLMRRHGVAKVTARKAVARLRERGWVITVPHRGTYVSAREKWPVD